MKASGRGIVAALLGAQLSGCVAATPSAGPAAGKPVDDAAVAVREDLSGRFAALIGPKTQHDPPYLGTPYTNFSCLRSFIDRRNGDTAHQLYVAASYDIDRDWDAAHDDAGQALKFIPISRFKIACNGKINCSYAEEFAAIIPESELIRNPRGFSVTFTDRAGDAQTIAVSGNQVAAQLAALAQRQKNGRPPPASSVTR
jgi:hypothetical protein